VVSVSPVERWIFTVRLTLLALVLAASVAGSARAATQGAALPPPVLLPHWHPAVKKQTLDKVFGGAKPVRTFYVAYPRKMAVIFEFSHVVICRTCSAPSNVSIPRGKVIRVSFDRQTHRLNGSMQFCESRGTKPSRALCLRR
jgi:hypothetical protein